MIPKLKIINFSVFEMRNFDVWTKIHDLNIFQGKETHQIHSEMFILAMQDDQWKMVKDHWREHAPNSSTLIFCNTGTFQNGWLNHTSLDSGNLVDMERTSMQIMLICQLLHLYYWLNLLQVTENLKTLFVTNG